jgi:hypothetical protein
LPDGNSYNHKLGEGCGIFSPTDLFEMTEARAIAKAQKIRTFSISLGGLAERNENGQTS